MMRDDEINAELAAILNSTCRFAGAEGHVCRTSFGMPTGPGQVCFSEARAHLLDMHPELRT